MQLMKASQKKQYITLIEIMIVMFLIALIAGVVAYNYRGSLDEGRAFETTQNIAKVRNILELEIAKDRNPANVDLAGGKWKEILRKSPLLSNSETITKDGWGNELQVSKDDKGEIIIFSIAPFCMQNPDKCPSENRLLLR